MSKKTLIILISVIIVLIIGFYLFRLIFPIDIFILKDTMEPTLSNGEKIALNKIDKEYKYKDIVIVKDPRHAGEYIITRVIGLPGETIEIKNGNVFINEAQLNEDYIKGPTFPASKTKLNANQYFVMSDNRNVSADSRLFGPISADIILGKAILNSSHK